MNIPTSMVTDIYRLMQLAESKDDFSLSFNPSPQDEIPTFPPAESRDNNYTTDLGDQRIAKPCNWEYRYGDTFVGSGKEVDLPGGEAALVNIFDAYFEAYENVMETIFTRLVEDVENISCQAGCHKQWGFLLPRPGGRPFYLDGVFGPAQGTILNVEKSSVLIGTHYTCTITAKAHLFIRCTTEGEPSPIPDKDEHFAPMLNRTKALFDEVVELLRRIAAGQGIEDALGG